MIAAQTWPGGLRETIRAQRRLYRQARRIAWLTLTCSR